MRKVKRLFHRTHEASQFESVSRYVESGLSVIPIKCDGTKAPSIPWKKYQAKRATQKELTAWFSKGNDTGLAIVGGRVSGNLEILDFDDETLFVPWKQIVATTNPDLVDRLPIIRTPSGGYHVYFRCSEIGTNQKLAQLDRSNPKFKTRATLIETRGEGGYVLAPPSPRECHPSGQAYVHYAGPGIESTPMISATERQVLLNAASSPLK